MTKPIAPSPVHADFGAIVVVGGGCYGSQYVRQLRRARAAGKATWRALIVVDRDPDCAHERAVAADPAGASDLSGAPDAWAGIRFEGSEWTPFFARWLADAAAEPHAFASDTIVPSPLMPHLLFEWLVARARSRWPAAELNVEVPGELAGVPWQKAGMDGTRYASYATWICPINCIEPQKCPHTGGPRDWSFHDSLRREPDATALLRVTHRHYGVGMIDIADVVAADALIRRELPAGRTVRVATASHCHGAVAGLRMTVAVSPTSPPSEI